MQRKRILKKGALGVALVLLAALVTFIIKDLLAVRQPENSLPSVTVTYNGVPLPAMHVVRASYSWRFLTGPVNDGISEEQWLEVEHAPVLPDSPMEILFSYQPNDVQVSVARGTGPFTENSYTPLTEIEGGEIEPPSLGTYILYDDSLMFTPLEAGQYVFRIWADWGWRGSVLYYVKIDVRGGV